MAKSKNISYSTQNIPSGISTTQGWASLGILSTSGSTMITTGASGSYFGTTGWVTSGLSVYTILGQEVEIESYYDQNLAQTISLINVLGMKLYIELKKNGVPFPKEITYILENELTKYNRDNLIEEIIKN